MAINPQQWLGLIDLTSLNHSDTPEHIQALCQKAMTPKGHVAAVCIYPCFIELARNTLSGTSINIATVINFPEGKNSLAATCNETENALAKGADEIDLVMPYHAYLHDQQNQLQEQRHEAINFIKQIKKIVGSKILKVILETGALEHPKTIFEASYDAIEARADFIKTSTGKTTLGATPQAAHAMLSAIKAMQAQGYRTGFKAAGGIKTIAQAEIYINLATDILGKDWITPQHFRLGVSGLVDEILKSERR